MASQSSSLLSHFCAIPQATRERVSRGGEDWKGRGKGSKGKGKGTEERENEEGERGKGEKEGRGWKRKAKERERKRGKKWNRRRETKERINETEGKRSDGKGEAVRRARETFPLP